MSHRDLTLLRPVILGLVLASTCAVGAGASGSGSATDPDVTVVTPPRHGRPMLVTGKRGFLGVDLLELTPELRRHFGVDGEGGVLVAHVEEGSPAALAGLAVGDVLTAIDGKPVKSSWSLRQLVAPKKTGDTVALDVVRDRNRRQLQAALVEREGRMLDMGHMMRGHLMEDGDGDNTVIVFPDSKEWERFGREWGKMGEEWGKEFGKMGEQIGAEVAEAMSRPEVRMRLESEAGDRAKLQQRINELEQRLRELEKRLDEHNRR